MKHPEGSQAQFGNRVRILLNLPRSAFPRMLREENPRSAAHWDNGGFDRLRAFIEAPDPVQDALWRAVLDYEGKDQSNG